MRFSKRNTVVLCLLSLLACLALLLPHVHRLLCTVSDMRGRRIYAVAYPSIRNWSQLRQGMSRDEVIQLIGDTQHRLCQSSSQSEFRASSGALLGVRLEMWEYGWSHEPDRPHGGVSVYAWVVCFRPDGTLVSWSEPQEPLPFTYWLYKRLTQQPRKENGDILPK